MRLRSAIADLRRQTRNLEIPGSLAQRKIDASINFAARLAPRNEVLCCYLFRPSIGVIVSFANSMPSMQLTLSATTSVPSGLLPRANTSTPQSMQS